jgi:hypothetical protein
MHIARPVTWTRTAFSADAVLKAKDPAEIVSELHLDRPNGTLAAPATGVRVFTTTAGSGESPTPRDLQAYRRPDRARAVSNRHHSGPAAVARAADGSSYHDLHEGGGVIFYDAKRPRPSAPHRNKEVSDRAAPDGFRLGAGSVIRGRVNRSIPSRRTLRWPAHGRSRR